jgi:hypothetical protein
MKMSKPSEKRGFKPRSAVRSEEAAVFRVACGRLGIDQQNCFDRLGVRKSSFYNFGNGNHEIPSPVLKLIASMEAYEKLKILFRELQAELETLKGVQNHDPS